MLKLCARDLPYIPHAVVFDPSFSGFLTHVGQTAYARLHPAASDRSQTFDRRI